jgi:TolB-like protein
MSSLFAELKRRKVVRVAVVYAATAFAVLQAADIMLPQMNVPEWAMGLLVALVVLGFPFALVLAWALELTPDGLKRTESAPSNTGNAATPALLGKRTVFAAALLVVLGIGIGAGWFLRPAGGPDASPVGQTRQVVGPDVSAETSIAVLPFLNMSTDPENAFFADGISEELLNVLVRVEGLKVASRTSAFSFKGSNTPIPEIAQQLGVRHILEGSVRRQGNRVRITAQLIETDSDTHLWSETYERDLVDIFRVQEEIARAITTALEGVLGVRKVSVAAPTTDLEAYERFLRGRTRYYQRVGLDEAIADLRFAVERDPDFAEAWAFLGAASSVVGTGGYPTAFDREELVLRALSAAERALALNPDLGMALAVKGKGLTDIGDPERMIEGIRLLEQAADRAAADSSAQLWLGLTWMELGFVAQGLPYLVRAQESDPLVAHNNGYLGHVYAIQGRWQEGARLARRAMELNGMVFWTSWIAIERANAGDPAAARALLKDAQGIVGPDASQLLSSRQAIEDLLAALEDPARQAEWLAGIELDEPQGHAAVGPVGPAGPMELALVLRDADRVFLLADSVWKKLVSYIAWLPSLDWLREDPRFYERMSKHGVAGFWEANGFPPGCRPVDDPAGRRLDCSGYAP